MLGDIYGLYYSRTSSFPFLVPSPPSATLGTAGRIILVEDYDALSIAFGSTLRKLAPSCHTVVVRSLAEAEIAAAASKPDLFVIDFDPPHAGAVAFFNGMKAAHPDARVLVIGAMTWLELAHERVYPGALHFIAKPFELAKFGEAVQALLPSEQAPAILPAAGTLRDLDLTDLIALFGVAAVTTILRVTATSGATGEIYFSAGQITQAVVMGKSGVPALEEMLRWPSPRFVENEMRANPPRALHGPWTSVLLEALRSVQTTERSAEPGHRTAVVPAPPEKQIVVVDDTEMLLIFVEDILHTARPSLKIATAASGLEGVRRITELLPDLVLLDYSLPDVAGDEVCRLLLEDARTAHVPVIMMSGHVAEMATTAALFPNVVATIAKPFLSAALIDLVDATLTNPPKVVAAPAQETKSPLRQPSKKTRKAPSPPKVAKSAAKTKKNPPPPPAAPPSKPAASTPSPSAPTSAPAKKAHHNGAHKISKPAEPPLAPESKVASALSVEPPPEIAPEPGKPASSDAPGLANEPAPPTASKEVPPQREAGVSTLEDNAILGRASPGRIRALQASTVVLTLPLEITSIQFSPSFQVRAIRAKAQSPIVSMHALPEAGSRPRTAAMIFKLDHVELDTRGQIRTARLTPSAQPIVAPDAESSVIVAEVDAFPDDGTIEMTSSPKKPTRIQLLALFEIVAVELTATFGVEHLILQTRGAKVRLHLRAGEAGTGITFRSAQILLDHSGLIAEVLLDKVE